MNISGAGSAYLNNQLFSGGTAAREKMTAGKISDFEKMLRKSAAEPKNAGGGQPSTDTEIIPASSSPFAEIDKNDKLYEQCLELEIFLVKTLVSGMRSTVQKSGLIDEGFAGKMYEDMLYDEYARDFAENADFGMAEMAYIELTGQRGKIIRP